MADIEHEFRSLVQGMIDQINDKKNKGELNNWDADKLLEMVNRIDTSLDGETCPEGHDYECGWSSSMGYHCF
jgi:hypothetical protein